MQPNAPRAAPTSNTSPTPRPGSPAGGGLTTFKPTLASIEGSLPRSVIEWTPGNAITDCRRAQIADALAVAEAMTRPINLMQLAEGLRTLLAIYPQPAGWNAELAMKGYVEVLAELPPDLFAEARGWCLRRVTRLPSPAQILEPVRVEFQKRKNLVLQLRWVLARADIIEARERPITAEERAKALALLDEAKKKLGASKPQPKRRAHYIDLPESEREKLLDRVSPKGAHA